MKIIPILSFSIFLSGYTYAQQVVSSAGGDAKGPGGTAAYTAGEVFYTSKNNKEHFIKQGVQQPYEISTVGVEGPESIILEISVYPNPAGNHVNLKIDEKEPRRFAYKLYDLSGTLIYGKPVSAEVTSISLEEVPNGGYFLKITDDGKEVKTFKIIRRI